MGACAHQGREYHHSAKGLVQLLRMCIFYLNRPVMAGKVAVTIGNSNRLQEQQNVGLCLPN
jgi:hypothetical protein